jgi:hypothetical protein
MPDDLDPARGIWNAVWLSVALAALIGMAFL